MKLVNASNIIILLLVFLLIGFTVYAIFNNFKKFILINKLYKESTANRNYRYYNLRLQFIISNIILLLFSITISLISLRFVTGEEVAETFNSNIDMMFLVDSSLSMKVEDTADGSRLESAKTNISNFLVSQNGHRFGLVTYNHIATVESPLTIDKEMIKVAVETIIPVDESNAEGSSMAVGLKMARERLLASNDVFGSSRRKVLIIVSDGEEIDSKSSDLTKEIQLLRKNNINVFVLGVGSNAGGKIPWFKSTIDGSQNYILGPNYKPAVSKLEEGMLKDVATQTKGRYMKIESISTIEDLLKSDNSDLSATEDESMTYDETYCFLAGIGVIIMLFVLLDITELKTKIRSNKRK